MSGWFDLYRSKVTSPERAVDRIESGQRVYIHPGAAEPEVLVRALIARAPGLRSVEVIHLLTLGDAGYVRPGMEPHFRHTAMFVGGNVRDAVNTGRADYMPIFLSEIPALFASGAMPLDVCLVQLSPPDEHGFCSFGVGVDTTKGAAAVARTVIAAAKRVRK
jgi:acyl-CoA hydrolase